MGGDTETRAIYTTCSQHCGGACRLKVHLKGGTITRIETDDGPEPQMRACLRGRAMRERVYSPDRLKRPMKRTGPRGSGEFEEVSWDDALSTVAGQMKRVKEAYGPSAILSLHSGGDMGGLHGRPAVLKLLSMFGGYSSPWGICSFEGSIFADVADFGTTRSHSSPADLANSRMIIIWGWDPAVTISDCNTGYHLLRAREKGIPVFVVDPRLSDTAAAMGGKWIPIRPGTDTAMLLAMSFVIVNEGLQDQSFIERYTVGFDRYRDYIMGLDDGIAKAPGWAEPITGVPSETIADLARQYATARPAALAIGIGPGRTAYGEQYHRAANALTAITGNIGVRGGKTGRAYGGVYAYPEPKLFAMPTGANPVEKALPRRKNFLKGREVFARAIGEVNRDALAEAMLNGRSDVNVKYKLLVVTNASPLTQHLNTHKHVKAFETMEFIVVMDQFMTPTARYADIVLPTCTVFERNDFCVGSGGPFYGYMRKVIEPLFDSRSHLDICRGLATHLGLREYADKTEDEWLKEMARNCGISDYDAFRETGIVRKPMPEPYVAFADEIRDPQHHPFPTPSGKIEIYSQRIADLDDPLLPAIPKYIAAWEGHGDPLAGSYPLQLLTTHSRRRAHSQMDNVPWLREIEPQSVTVNTGDARARGIVNGDTVKVLNDRGAIVAIARVTERIMPGVVNVTEGSWYRPDAEGVDQGGCANVLTRDQPSPAGAMPSNTALVEVVKATSA